MINAAGTHQYQGHGFRQPHVRPDRQAQTTPQQDSKTSPVAQKTRTDAETQTLGDLQIVTGDGDQVHISFAATSQLHSKSTNSQQSTTQSSASAVEVTVKGSLSDGELSDITKLIGTLGSAIHDTQQGNSQQAAQDLQGTSSLGSLQSFLFAYQQQSQYSQIQSGSSAPSGAIVNS